MLYILLCSTAGVISVSENVHIENLEAKSVLVGRSYFYHFNDCTFSKKFRVLTNRSIVRIATAAGKNSQI